ncbi:MAG TPA: hypothetical protein VMF67_12175 [Rhizomicrobium sp.]|nr:hypothetical protein [Rhizomicrobium sp.]
MSAIQSDDLGASMHDLAGAAGGIGAAWPPRADVHGGQALSGMGIPASLEGIARFVAVLLLFSLVTVVFFWPLIAHPGSALFGPPDDNMQDFWNTWYAVAGQDHANFFFTNLLRFPEGTSLIYQSFAYPQVFAVVGLSRIFGADRNTLVALQNITILASFPLAGTGAFYLVRHFVRSTPGALAGGYVFAFNPSHLAHALHHAHVSSIEFLPFFALAWLLALERRSVLWLGAAILSMALSALSCWYYLFYCAYFIGFQLLYQRIRDGQWPRGWFLIAPAACLAGTVMILAPLIVPMVMAAQPSVYDGGGNTFVADLAAYLAFPPEHVFSALSRSLYARFTGYPTESVVYLGVANCAALGWVLLRGGLARNSINLYVLLGLIFFCVLASGEALHVAGIVTPLHLPDVVLDKLPFFANIRTPSRAIVFAYLFLAIGTGLAVSALFEDVRPLSRVTGILLAALIVLDFYPVNLETTPVACSRGLAPISSDRERGFGVLDLPIGYVEENAYMLQQTCDGVAQMGGATTREMGQTLVNRLPLYDLRREKAELREAHVKYIIIHRPQNGLYGWGDSLLYTWDNKLPSISQFLRTYRAVYDGPDLLVLRVY